MKMKRYCLYSFVIVLIIFSAVMISSCEKENPSNELSNGTSKEEEVITYEQQQYSEAMGAFNKKKYNVAYKLFLDLKDYEDSKEKAELCKTEIKTADSLKKTESGLVMSMKGVVRRNNEYTGMQFDYYYYSLFSNDGSILIFNQLSDGNCFVFGNYTILTGATTTWNAGYGWYSFDGYTVYDRDYNLVTTSNTGSPKLIHSNLLQVGSLYYDNNLNIIDLSQYILQEYNDLESQNSNEKKYFYEGFAIVKDKESGNMGILRPDNSIVMIEEFYSTIDTKVKNGYLKVSKYNKYGFLDSEGKLIGDGCIWDFVDEFRNGYCTVALKENGEYKYGFINESGELIGDGCVWDGCKNFYEGLCAVKTDGKWGFIDTTGKLVIPAKYKELVTNFENGTAKMRDDEGFWVLIDNEGRTIIDKCYYIQEGLNENGYAIASRIIDGWVKSFAIDKNGEIISNSYGAGYNFLYNGDKTEILSGNIVITSNGNVVDLDEDRIITTWGRNGEWNKVEVLKTHSEDCLLIIQFNRKYGLMARNGTILLDCEYSSIEPIEDCGIAVAKVKKSNNKYGIIDSNGCFVFPAEYNAIEYSNGLFYLIKDGELIIFDTQMNQIL